MDLPNIPVKLKFTIFDAAYDAIRECFKENNLEWREDWELEDVFVQLMNDGFFKFDDDIALTVERN